MTHRVDDLKITCSNGTITITRHNRLAWDNEPSDTSISFPVGSVENLIDALRDALEDHRAMAGWGGPPGY